MNTTTSSLKSYAKIGGYLSLILIVCGPFSMMYVPFNLIETGDTATTANNIMASESLFRLSLVSDSIIFLTEIVFTVILYMLFKQVSKTLALIAAFSRLAMAIIQAANLFFNLMVILGLSGADYLAAFNTEQLHALVMFFLDAHMVGVHVWEAFLGLHYIPLAYLIYKSGYIPKILGVLILFASLGYLVNSFGNFMLPEYGMIYAAIVGIGALIGELPFMFYLLIKGVKAEKIKS